MRVGEEENQIMREAAEAAETQARADYQERKTQIVTSEKVGILAEAVGGEGDGTVEEEMSGAAESATYESSDEDEELNAIVTTQVARENSSDAAFDKAVRANSAETFFDRVVRANSAGDFFDKAMAQATGDGEVEETAKITNPFHSDDDESDDGIVTHVAPIASTSEPETHNPFASDHSALSPAPPVDSFNPFTEGSSPRAGSGSGKLRRASSAFKSMKAFIPKVPNEEFLLFGSVVGGGGALPTIKMPKPPSFPSVRRKSSNTPKPIPLEALGDDDWSSSLESEVFAAQQHIAVGVSPSAAMSSPGVSVALDESLPLEDLSKIIDEEVAKHKAASSERRPSKSKLMSKVPSSLKIGGTLLKRSAREFVRKNSSSSGNMTLDDM